MRRLANRSGWGAFAVLKLPDSVFQLGQETRDCVVVVFVDVSMDLIQSGENFFLVSAEVSA